MDLQLNKDRLLKQSNDVLVKSLLVVAHIQRTVQGLDSRTLQRDVAVRHQQLVNNSEHCLHSLIPAKHDETIRITNPLCTADQLPRLFAKTNRFKNSSISFGLANYQ